MHGRLQLRPVEEPAAAPGPARSHPMIDAGIASLPPIGVRFSGAQRDAWFELMRNAFVLAYGEADGERSIERREVRRMTRKASIKTAPAPKPGTRGKPAKIEPEFYIDRQNFVRRRGGDRILPSQVAGYIVDQRGINGALETIVWADGEVGPPKGVALDITVGEASE